MIRFPFPARRPRYAAAPRYPTISPARPRPVRRRGATGRPVRFVTRPRPHPVPVAKRAPTTLGNSLERVGVSAAAKVADSFLPGAGQVVQVLGAPVLDAATDFFTGDENATSVASALVVAGAIPVAAKLVVDAAPAIVNAIGDVFGGTDISKSLGLAAGTRDDGASGFRTRDLA